MPPNNTRDESLTVKQVVGKLVAADADWIAVEVTQGSGSLPRTTYVRTESIVVVDVSG